MAGGEANHGSVGQIDGALHESLAEGAASDDECAVVVLHGAGDNLGSRGAELIDQDNEAPLAEESAGLCLEHLFGCGASFGVDHEIFGIEELAGHLHGCSEVASAVAFEVEKEIFHALLLQSGDGFAHFFAGGGTEAVQPDVADAGCDHVGRIEGVHRNFVAGDDKGEHAVDGGPDDAERHLRAFGSAQELHDAVALEFHAGNGASVDRNNAIAVGDAGFLRRPFGDGLNHHEGIFEHVELHADAFEVTFEGFVHAARFLGIGVGRVGIEFREHAVDGVLDELFLVDTVDVELRDGQLRDGQFAHEVRIGLFECAAPLCGGRQEGDQGHDQGQKPVDEGGKLHVLGMLLGIAGRKALTSLPKESNSRTTVEEMSA